MPQAVAQIETGSSLTPQKVPQAAALFAVEPIGVSGFELTRALSEILQTSLPSIEQIESELGGFAE